MHTGTCTLPGWGSRRTPLRPRYRETNPGRAVRANQSDGIEFNGTVY